MILQDGKLCLSQAEMRRVVADGLKSVFIANVDVQDVFMQGTGPRPFDIVLGPPVPPKKEVAKK